MDDRRFIKPRDGLPVLYPEAGRNLREHGEGVAWNSWWQRRLGDGDVEQTTEEVVAKAEAAAARAAEKLAKTEGETK